MDFPALLDSCFSILDSGLCKSLIDTFQAILYLLGRGKDVATADLFHQCLCYAALPRIIHA
jgi:hypothetical protein